MHIRATDQSCWIVLFSSEINLVNRTIPGYTFHTKDQKAVGFFRHRNGSWGLCRVQTHQARLQIEIYLSIQHLIMIEGGETRAVHLDTSTKDCLHG